MTKSHQVYLQIYHAIDSGALRVDEALPAIRNAAVLFGVSKNTVIEAYQKLKSEGIVVSRPGAGFFVAPRRYDANYKNLSPHFLQASAVIKLLESQLIQRHRCKPGEGRYPHAWAELLSEQIHDASNQRILSNIADTGQYGHPQGYSPLLECLRAHEHERLDMAHHHDVLTTAGANHALDLVIRHFLDSGDHVVVESPGYYPLFAKLALHKVRIHSIERSANGIDLEKLAALFQSWKPKLFFLQPNIHNPTGHTLSLEMRKKIIALAKRHRILLIEDDPLGDLYPELPSPLFKLSSGQNVIYISSFSKTMLASLRCGYIVAEQAITRSLQTLKLVTMVNSSAVNEAVVFHLIDSGCYQRHLQLLSERLYEARRQSLAKLSQLPFTSIEGKKGFYLWCHLPAQISDVDIAAEADKAGIFLAPGRLFMPDIAHYPALRMNVAHCHAPLLHTFLTQKLVN